jgi:hypothetical protein
MEWEEADFIRGAQDWDKWRGLVNTVTKLRNYEFLENSSAPERGLTCKNRASYI